VEDVNGVVTTTEHDALDRVVWITEEGATPAEDRVTEHVYDELGNLEKTVLPAHRPRWLGERGSADREELLQLPESSMSRTKSRQRALLALSLLLLALLGCSHLKGPFDPVEGRNFAAEKVKQLEEGTPAKEVIRLLGEPLEREPVADGEQWRYYVVEERVDELRFLGLVPVRVFRWKRVTEATLRIADGQVAAITYDSEVIPPE
jgi:outer membrane protein assembly factor BamE (lipoprotein component of BamABCDE complex)